MSSEQAPAATLSKYTKRVALKTILGGSSDGGVGLTGHRVVIGGWIKSSSEIRKQPVTPQPAAAPQVVSPKDVTCSAVLQSRIPLLKSIMKVLVDSALATPCQVMPTGTCLLIEGILQQPSVQGKHVEVASAMRIHNALTWATHGFFQDQGFLHVQVPIITSTDSEGFSEKFLVTTLLSKGKKDDQISSTEDAGDLKKTNELVSQLETRQKAKSGVAVETRKLDLSKDLFAHQTYLTVSGRLHLESQACALGNVYCFGHRFQAEKSESKKSLAETWMVDVEMAFSELEDAMDCANDFLKFVCKRMVEGCMEDLQFVLKQIDKAVMERLQSTISSSFERISYAEAIEVLRQVAGKRFHSKIEFGVSLTEEHQSYLVDEIYKKPVIIYNDPKGLEPFYVRVNDDGKTVATFNVVLPKLKPNLFAGRTVIRGSQSEERFNVLNSRMNELGLQKQQHEWYLDLRRHGSAKTSGFSLMLEPLVLYATGLNDVKDVIPFPRSFRRANS
ncbi:hypothetical protein RND71_013014 [Anisodus tanguticus]|uniref:Aminoacyl-tRNA synthetase class II (D/K/N) domain-containing protein n=1 Tax=Anisodus tanguticus TaxID=243964 RepID=A0AAE1SGH4_9SOLA|nr:hypothetical protein RND71_013014 [Anisodus tanguticus]